MRSSAIRVYFSKKTKPSEPLWSKHKQTAVKNVNKSYLLTRFSSLLKSDFLLLVFDDSGFGSWRSGSNPRLTYFLTLSRFSLQTAKCNFDKDLSFLPDFSLVKLLYFHFKETSPRLFEGLWNCKIDDVATEVIEALELADKLGVDRDPSGVLEWLELWRFLTKFKTFFIFLFDDSFFCSKFDQFRSIGLNTK